MEKHRIILIFVTLHIMNIDRRNALTVKGKLDGPVLMMAHGYGCSQDMWRLLVPYFEQKYRIVLFDHIGSGNSDAKMYNKIRYDSLHGYALDMLEICTHLDLKDISLVCHSVSCMIGILAANMRPDLFSRLVLIAPSPCFINEGEYQGGFDVAAIDGLIEAMETNYTSWSGAITPVIMGNMERPELAGELNNSFCSMDREVARDFGRITFRSDHRKDLPLLKVKSLILQCSDDLIAPPYVGKYVHEHLEGSVLHNLKATGHCPHLSAPAETAAAITEYLEKSPA